MSWLQGKKIVLKWNLLLFYAKTMNNFSTGLWCAIKSGFYMTAGDDQLSAGQRRCSKALPQIKLTPKEGYGHCLVVSCQSDPLQLSESWQNHYIWEVCSANWWDTPKTTTPAAGLNQKKGHNTSWQCLTTHHTDQASKVNELGYEILPHPYLPELLTSDYQFFKHLDNFLQGKCFHNHQEAEKAFQELIKS